MIKSNLMPEHRLITVSTNRRQSICPFLAQVMSKSTKNFDMTFAKNWTYRASEFTGTEMNRHSDKT